MKRICCCLLAALLLVQSACALAIASRYGEAFTLAGEGSIVPIPAAYEVYTTVKYLGDAGFMNHPGDLFVGPDGLIYIADTENNRVLKLSRDGEVLSIYTEAQGTALKMPRGVYVGGDGGIWIADTGNLRIAVLNADGSDRAQYTKPDSPLLENNFTFDVQKLYVAETGYIYALKGANLISLDQQNNFHGYLGAAEVGFSLSRFLIRIFGSRAQVERTVKQEPSTYSNFMIGADGMIYGLLTGTRQDQIRRLNSVGNNTYPKGVYGITFEGTNGNPAPPTLADVAVQANGILSVLDSTNGLIYQYDQEGNLLVVFGGLGEGGGLYQLPVSIAAGADGYLYVLDYTLGSMTVLRPTHFIQQVHQAVTLHGEGRYDEALTHWREVLRMDANYMLAHQGVAKILGKQDDWSGALAEYTLAGDKDGYSEAFGEYRQQVFRDNFLPVVLIAAAIVFAAGKLLFFARRRARIWAKDVQMGGDLS